MLEMRPISALATRRGIIESLKTIENSAATEARQKNSSGQDQAASRVPRTTAATG